MSKRIENFLKNLSLEELVEARDAANQLIGSYADGYFYICKVYSYGRNWKQFPKNVKVLEDLCYEYGGDEGVLYVYSNNPDIGKVYSSGGSYFVPTMEDYEKWHSYDLLKKLIPEIEKEWEEWENRDNVPFNSRPYFAPIHSKEDLESMKKRLEEYDMNFTAPVNANLDENE
jgi:hypothetical protein